MTGMPISLMEDNPPLIRFKTDVKEDRSETLNTGKIGYRNVNIVTLIPHGDNKTSVEHEVSDWLKNLRERLHNKQISKNYYDFCVRSYEAWEKKEEMVLDGTPIKGWQLATPAQQKLMIDCNIMTVEALANATEDAIQAIGMGARALKDRATNWLADAASHGKTAMQIESLTTELESARKREEETAQLIRDMQAQINELQKPKRGRPAKED